MTPKAQLDAFLDAYTPAIAKQARAILKKMKGLVPGARWLVYDNYNALAIAFSPTEKVSDVVCSVALYPRWVSVFFMHGKSLPDPSGLLQGAGTSIRHVVIDELAVLGKPAFVALVRAAVKRADPKLDPKAKHAIVIKSISKKQRPRRPPPSLNARLRKVGRRPPRAAPTRSTPSTSR